MADRTFTVLIAYADQRTPDEETVLADVAQDCAVAAQPLAPHPGLLQYPLDLFTENFSL